MLLCGGVTGPAVRWLSPWLTLGLWCDKGQLRSPWVSLGCYPQKELRPPEPVHYPRRHEFRAPCHRERLGFGVCMSFFA